MRNYIVPDPKAPIWRMYENNLRMVGRSQARVKQLEDDVANGTPPSWCFGGTQAPIYMRPYHHRLVTLTQEYAVKMAKTTISIIMDQATKDAAQARHLQETLVRMYKEDNDPNIELALGRADGIAAHYTRKEVQLNRRIKEEDEANIPKSFDEWADVLSRRKTTKPSTRSRSRSKSRDRKKAAKRVAAQQAQVQNQKKPTHASGQKPPQPKRSNQQSSQKQQTWKKPKTGPQHQGTTSYTSTYSSAPRTSTSTSSLRDGSGPSRSASNQQVASGSHSIPRPTNLNAEEMRLITMLRASKNN